MGGAVSRFVPCPGKRRPPDLTRRPSTETLRGLPRQLEETMSDATALPGGVPRLGDRSLFPTLQPRVYWNHASISPASQPVIDHVLACVTDSARRGAGSFPTWLEHRRHLRGQIGQLLGVAPADLAFVQSTTSGLVALAQSLPWQSGDRIVVFAGEFPGNVTPWQQAAARFGLGLVMLPVPSADISEAAFLQRLEDECKRGVRLIAVSAVQFQTGLRMPVAAMAAIAHRLGAEICVDAVQALGAVALYPLELDIDYLACGSHKWLMGPEGSGFVYVSPKRITALRTNMAGWLSHQEGIGFLSQGPGHLRYDRPIRHRADMLEAGNLSSLSLAGLQASVHLILTLGVPAIAAHIQRCLTALEDPLVERGFTSVRSRREEQRSGLLCVRPPQGVDVVALHAALAAQGVSCSIPDGYLRFSPHWPSQVAQVDAILDAIDTALHGLSRHA